MPFCPKCDDEYQPGFETCVDCQVALVETRGLAVPEEKREAEEEAYAAAFFPDGDEEIIFCPSCWNEFAVAGARCVPCGNLVVEKLTRPEFEGRVAAAPITRQMAFDVLPADDRETLTRIHEAQSPLEAAYIADSLGGMGVDVHLGHDGLDGLERPQRIGIWVPKGEAEAAVMLLPEDDEFQASEPKNDYASILEAAMQYLEFRKYRAVSGLLEKAMTMEPERPEAFMTFGMAAGRQGHVEAAAEAFDGAVERASASGRLDSRFEEALYLSAVHHFLGNDAQPKYDGAGAEAGWVRLGEYLERRPRRVEAQLLRLDAAAARGHDGRARETLADLEAINPQLFRVAGRHTEIREHLS